MSGEQIRQVLVQSQRLDPANDQAVNSRQIANASDQEFKRLAHSSRHNTLELCLVGAEDNDGLLQQACTALAEEIQGSAGSHASAKRDHGSMLPDMLQAACQ